MPCSATWQAAIHNVHRWINRRGAVLFARARARAIMTWCLAVESNHDGPGFNRVLGH